MITGSFEANQELWVEKKSDGVKIMRWEIIYPAADWLSGAGAFGPKIRNNFWKILTVRKIVAHCQKWAIPYLNTLRDNSIFLYINKNRILIHCRNYTLFYYLAETIT